MSISKTEIERIRVDADSPIARISSRDTIRLCDFAIKCGEAMGNVTDELKGAWEYINRYDAKIVALSALVAEFRGKNG